MASDPACRDFHRTDAQRRSLMDRPLSRRSLLRLGVGATMSIYAARALPFTRMLEAAEAQAADAPGAPVLVNVFVPGGLDLLDTIVPMAQQGRYADLRRTTRVEDALALGSTGLGMHPVLGRGIDGGLKGLFDRGQLGLLPGIDYPNPDLSHFNSRHFWETGITSLRADAGWLARWLDRHGGQDNPFQGLSMDSSLVPVLRGGRAPVAAIESPDDTEIWVPGVWGEWREHLIESYLAVASRRPGKPGPAAVDAAARQSRWVADRLAPYRREDKNAADPLASSVQWPVAQGDTEPSGVAKQLRTLAALVAQPLGIRIACVQADGEFDTHDDQKATLNRDLGTVGDALVAFQADLAARGVADRVLTFVWTEFGRRPEENASGGTDHGAGGLAFVMGSRVRGGVLSDYPDLTSFDREDNLKVTVDFRAVYASLLEQWLGTPADEILPDAKTVGRVQVVA